MSNLVVRALTAVVLVPLLLASLFADPTIWSILGVAALAVIFAQDEFLRMALPVTDALPWWGMRAVSGCFGAALLILAVLYGLPSVLPPLLAGFTVVVSVLALSRPEGIDSAGRRLAAAWGGMMYVPMMASVWPLLKHEFPEAGASWLLLALVIAFGSDTCAYFVGRAFGRRPLYAAVSPNKTIAGAIGGMLGGVIAAAGLGSSWLLPQIPVAHGIALGVLGSVCGQLGDLVESLIKRTFGVKDSGALLPGHGGMLDRVDGLLFVAPVVYFYAALVAAAP